MLRLIIIRSYKLFLEDILLEKSPELWHVVAEKKNLRNGVLEREKTRKGGQLVWKERAIGTQRGAQTGLR